jgi:organic radical activating enzyme
MSNIDGSSSVLKVSEIFKSIQGEGTFAGTPCIFLRLSTCNLKCFWCDTKYTWDWQNYDIKKEIKELRIKDIIKEFYEFPNIFHIVITGGEPLLQQDKLISLLTIVKNKRNRNNKTQGYRIEIETNGTIVGAKEIISLIDQWNISPKTSNSLNEEHHISLEKLYDKSMPFYKDLKNTSFKFVVDKPNDLSEIDRFVKKYEIPKEKLILMPQASTKQELLEKNEWLKKIAKESDFNFTTRLQVLLWNNQRGK